MSASLVFEPHSLMLITGSNPPFHKPYKTVLVGGIKMSERMNLDPKVWTYVTPKATHIIEPGGLDQLACPSSSSKLIARLLKKFINKCQRRSKLRLVS